MLITDLIFLIDIVFFCSYITYHSYVLYVAYFSNSPSFVKLDDAIFETSCFYLYHVMHPILRYYAILRLLAIIIISVIRVIMNCCCVALADTCADCHANADCLNGKCVCKTGYTGNGKACQPESK